MSIVTACDKLDLIFACYRKGLIRRDLSRARLLPTIRRTLAEDVMENRGPHYDVLFLSNGNCARSLMAEAILNREGRGRFRAQSAGINGGGAPDQDTVSLLKSLQFDLQALRSKDWSDLAVETGPAFHFVFTLSEEAKLLPRSTWKGHPIFAHWGLPDPARAKGNDAQIRLAYADTFRMLSNRIGIFVNLPMRSLGLLNIQSKLDTIGVTGTEDRSVATRDNRSVA
jgi:protein-tyrosine-phosphatase